MRHVSLASTNGRCGQQLESILSETDGSVSVDLLFEAAQ